MRISLYVWTNPNKNSFCKTWKLVGALGIKCFFWKLKNSSWFIISYWDSWKFIFKFLQEKLSAQAICIPFLVLFFFFFLDEWGNFINRKIITWSSKDRKTEQPAPAAKRQATKAKLKQTQTKITKQHPILYWHFKTCSSSITLTSI